MRLTVARSGDSTAVFVVDGDNAVNVTAVDPSLGTDLAAIIAGGADSLAQAAQAAASGTPQSLADLTLALPIARPGKVICLGLNYADHAKEGGPRST